MNEAYRSADVFVRGRKAGTVRETDMGYSFCYDDGYLRSEDPLAVSLTLPLKNEEYRSPVLFPFFDGLIPEGWLLDVAARNWKLDKRDRFGLLMVCCADCIGDVSVSKGGHPAGYILKPQTEEFGMLPVDGGYTCM